MPAPAKITYVDATDGRNGNTRLAIGEEFAAKLPPLIGNDNLWSRRPEGNGGSVFTTNDGRPSGPEDGPQLVTTVSGLTPGDRYRLSAYFWTDHHNWQLKASLAPLSPPATDAAASFSKNGTPNGTAARLANANDFIGPVIVTEANRQLLQAELGETAADSNGEIHVWVDDMANTGHSNRTWYDGVGLLPVTEPRLAFSPRSLVLVFSLVAIVALLLYLIASLSPKRGRSAQESDADEAESI